MSIYNKLFDWQQEIVDEYKNRPAFGLFLDMGMGKTPVSLAFAEAQESDKILIVTTDSKAVETQSIKDSFLGWASQAEIKYNLYNKKYSFIDKGPKIYQATISNDTKDVYIINYESLFVRQKDIQLPTKNKRSKEKFCKLNENIVEFITSGKNKTITIIIDESHKMKNTDSMQSIALFKIKKLAELYAARVYVYLLTGTPFTKGFEDLYNQLNMLGWNESKSKFKDAFCVVGNIPSLTSWQQPIVGYKNIPQLFDLLHHYSITMKTEEKVKLPEQLFVYHKLPQSQEMKLFTYDKLSANEINCELKKRHLTERVESGKRNGKVNNMFYANIDYPNLEWVADTPAAFYLRAKQLSIGFQGNSENAKWFNLNRLKELEKLLANNEDNYIIFYNYTPEFVELYEICEKLNYKIDIYNGLFKTERYYQEYKNMSDAQKLVEKKRVLLVNYASGSASKNWQEYNKVILFSIPLFGDFQQGLKRVHRIGQKETVIYHIFYENNWLDNKMLKALTQKKEYDMKMFQHDLSLLKEEDNFEEDYNIEIE